MTRGTANAGAIKPVMNHYTYRVGWSAPHGEYVGTCLELPFLWRKAPTAGEATAAVEGAVDEHLARLDGYGDKPPTPIADRRYSGTIIIRTSPELHSSLALEAAEQGVSMNQWVVQQSSGRRLSDGHGLSGWD